MRNHYRALSVEPVEDRSLPSTTFVFLEPTAGYGHHAEMPAAAAARAHEPRGWEARLFQAETVLRVRFADNSFLFIRETPTGFQIIPGTVTYFVPPPVQGPVADGATSAAGGSVQGGDAGRGPVAPTQGPARVLAAGLTAVGTGEVAVAPTAGSDAEARATTTEQAAAGAAASQVIVQNTPPVVPVAAPVASGHAAYAITATVPETENGADAVPPPADPAPTPMPEPAPAPDAGAEESLVQVAAAAVAPVAGLVPLDLAALSSGAGQFLDRVADLAPSWPDAMPGFTDTLWVAAAALLTGGAAHAGPARSAPRPVRDPVAGALSEWERRNGRSTG